MSAKTGLEGPLGGSGGLWAWGHGDVLLQAEGGALVCRTAKVRPW